MVSDPFDLNLRHLRALIAVQEHGSVTSASDIVALSQPALTQGIAKLERQFGYALFERQVDGMKATPEGELVVERVRAATAHLATSTGGMARSFEHASRLMTMTQLRAFLALADAGSYAAATRGTGLSQTAIHRAVGDLAQLLGRELVERRGRGVSLNASGKRLARGARLAIGEISAAIAELGLDPSGSLIAFGALPLSRPFLVPEALAKMMKEQPRTRFKVLEGGWSDLVEPLRDGLIDIIVGALRPHDVADLSQFPLYEDRLVIVARKGHPLAGTTMPSLETLCLYQWIVSPENSPLRMQWERLFEGRNLPDCPIECGSMMIITRLLTRGDCLALLSPSQVSLLVEIGKLTHIGPPLADTTRIVGVTTRANWRPTAVQRRFIDMLGEVSAEESNTAGGNASWLSDRG